MILSFRSASHVRQQSQREPSFFCLGLKKVKNLNPELQESGGFRRSLARLVCLMLFACLFRSVVPALIIRVIDLVLTRASVNTSPGAWIHERDLNVKCLVRPWPLAM